MGDFADRLRRWIKESGQSDAQAARRLGLQPQRLSNYLTGKTQPDFDTIVRICTTLDVSPNFLFGFPAPEAETEQAVIIQAICGRLKALDPAKLKLVRDLIGNIDAFEYPGGDQGADPK
jgi:transcriptional regulator with XRE-family HTH domain